MTTCFLAPDPVQSTFLIPGGNTPGNGAQVFFYVAGSNTKQTVYKDNAAAVAWTNPIVLDSGGNLPSGGSVWFPTGQSFKVVWAPSNDTDPPASPYRTIDNLAGINDVSVSAQTEWVSGPTPTFVSATSFTVAGDQRTTFTAGRRVKTTNTGGTVYSTIVSSVFGVLTTVTVVNDSGTLDAGLSAVFYGLLDPANSSIDYYHAQHKATAVASAGTGTTDIWGINGDYVHITGTNAIYNFSTAAYAGAEKTVVFDGVLTLNTSAALTIPGTASASTTANDRMIVRADTVSTAIVVSYVKASGKAFNNVANTQPTVSTMASGSGTYTPPANATRIWVRAAGGGGGGSCASNAPTAANNGSTTTFGPLTCNGGTAGINNGNPAAGGSASGGDFNVTGGAGGYGLILTNATGGSGGGNPLGAGGAVGGQSAPTGGGGGGGANSGGVNNGSGGGGGAGGYTEKMFQITVTTSFPFVVGPGGSAGTGGGGGTAGAGGSGVIIVHEFYD